MSVSKRISGSIDADRKARPGQYSRDFANCPIRGEYVGRACTLDGEPAKIVRDADGYASVAPLDPDKDTVPFCWVAVYNIMDNRGGKFGRFD